MKHRIKWIATDLSATHLHQNGDIAVDALTNLLGLARNTMQTDALGYYTNTNKAKEGEEIDMSKGM